MRFIYTAGDLQYFDGVEFFGGVPTTVENVATIERLKKNPDFMEVVERTIEPSEPVSGCPKCGRVIGRGRVMHEKHCKGIKA
jgi:hypothetical protein